MPESVEVANIYIGIRERLSYNVVSEIQVSKERKVMYSFVVEFFIQMPTCAIGGKKTHME